MASSVDLPAPPSSRRRFARGSIVASKYEIEEILEEGEIAIVALAKRRDLQQGVILKIVRPELASRESLASRALREARRISGLHSDHTVRVLDVGKTETGEPFVVTERLEGKYLSEVVKAEPPSPARALEIVAQACDAVAAAHAVGFVHGELTPRSIFLAKRSRGAPLVKVVGFGTASLRRAIEPSEGGLTPTRIVRGEPLYLAPEQLAPSSEIGARVDVWALGAIMYELLTGRAPFVGEGLASIVQSVAGGPIDPPSSIQNLPPALDEIVLKCLERDSSQRYGDARELLAAIDEVLEREDVRSLEAAPPVVAVRDDDERDSQTEIQPFPPEPDTPTPPVQQHGRVPTVAAPMVGDDPSAIIPSLATASDPSLPALHVRPHPVPWLQSRELARTRLMIFLLLLVFAVLIGILAGAVLRGLQVF